MIKALQQPKVRRWIYGILTAAGAVAVTYGLVTGEQLSVWLLLAANVLGTGLAFTKTNTGDGVGATNDTAAG